MLKLNKSEHTPLKKYKSNSVSSYGSTEFLIEIYG